MSLSGHDSTTTDDGRGAAPEYTPPSSALTWAEVGIIAGIWGVLAALSLVRTLTSECCAPSGWSETLLRASVLLSHHFVWFLMTVPIFWACRRLRPSRVGWSRTLGGHLALAVLILVLAELTSSNARTLLGSIWGNAETDYTATTPIEVVAGLRFLRGTGFYTILLVIGLGRDTYLRYRTRRAQAEQLERETERLRAQLTAARLETLRMQINPHFLFNTLHTVSTMAGHDPDGIRNAIARLSEMLRYALSTSDQQEVPLDKELRFLNSYLAIQKLRLDDRLDVTLDIAPDVRQALVPTLLLQPLAENAVKHGFEGTDGTGHLEVHARREDDKLVVQVADDGCGLADASALPETATPSDGASSDQDGHGLKNIAARLDGLYGDAASLSFERSDGGGLCVVIRLPFHTLTSDRDLRLSAVAAE